MLITPLLTRTVTITRVTDAETTDDYGNADDTEVEVEVKGELQQQRRTEPNAQGELSDTTWALFLPPGTAIATADTVTVDGDDYEVVGDPWPVRHPRTGAETHVEVTLRRTA